MAYTIQLHSLSGSFASPWGHDVEHASTLADVRESFQDWAAQHAQVGANQSDAHALVWHGSLEDVTDVDPSFELSFGPRGGIRRQPC